MTFKSDGDFFAIVFSPVPQLEARLGSDKMYVFDAPVGTLIVNPANVESGNRWNTVRENLTVGYEPGQLAMLAEQEFGQQNLKLEPPAFGHVDRRALAISHLLKDELASRTPSELYIDSLITVFGIHMIRHYSGGGRAIPRSKSVGGLSPKSARQVQEYLREKLSSRVSIAELARLCELSPSRFIVAFTNTFGEPPHRYLLKLRLAFAVELLASTDLPIAQIAPASGFSSQSHLTTTMRKHRGVTPAQLRMKRGS
ncbi:AraC family transcriptional regulator [Pelagibacterium sp. H642]|uniref:AraC family transcriptional regulator n=1 Tax=Pelagibacterium sp. H642 TaxID=1881069 RepID=UPI002815BF17|nr:AraC family transcriptional regulator [Pelagibacterium sp. H642]WMT92584.1 AraC family transcriptional regulator [Pelagibacterium sp. H642]